MSELTASLIVTRLRNAAKFEESRGRPNPNRFGLLEDAADLIEKLEAEKNDLDYKLIGVMHFVDKWLDNPDSIPDPVTRASEMREKTLRLVEKLQAENEQLDKKLVAAREEAAFSTGLLKIIENVLKEHIPGR